MYSVSRVFRSGTWAEIHRVAVFILVIPTQQRALAPNAENRIFCRMMPIRYSQI